MGIENIQIIETVSLDFYNNNIKIINVKQLDTDARGVRVNCTEHGKKFKLDPLSHSVFVRYKKPDGHDVLNDCYIQDDGSVIFVLTQQMTVIAGKSKLDIIILCSSGLTVENIGDVNNFSELGVSVLSTMLLGLNIHSNATDLANVESSYEYNALIEGLAKHVATERHMEELDKTLNANEEIRQENEATRQNSETNRNIAETNRVEAEQIREENVQNTINECIQKTDDNIEIYSSQMDELVETANTTIQNADNATTRANTSADNADNATSNAQTATSIAENKISEMQELINLLNDSVSGVINDTTSSEITTYSSVKIEKLIQELQNTINSLPKIYYGTEEPDDSIGKDGDIYMMIIEEVSEVSDN